MGPDVRIETTFEGQSDPTFFSKYFTQTQIIDRLKEYLKTCVDKNDKGFDLNRPGSSGGSSVVKGKNKRGAPSGSIASASKRAKTMGAPLTEPVEFHEVTAADSSPLNLGEGTFITFAFQSGYSIDSKNMLSALTYVLGFLEDRIRLETFTILEKAKNVPVTTKTTDGTEQILGALEFPSFAAIPKLVTINKQIEQWPIDTTKRVDPWTELRGGPNRKLPRVPFVTNKDGIYLGNELKKLLPDISILGDGCIWVPDELLKVFHDPVDYSLRYIAETATSTLYSSKTLGSSKPTEFELKHTQAPVYSVIGDKLWTAVLTKPVGLWSESGAGGQGAMRCDRPREYEASLTDGGKLLAKRLGITNSSTPDLRCTLTGEYTLPITGATAHQVVYKKSYFSSGAKKNLPAGTFPLFFQLPDAVRNDFYGPLNDKGKRNTNAKAIMKVSGLCMKQKGQRTGKKSDGVEISRPTSNRDQAGAVMGEALVKRFDDCGSLDLSTWNGSATKLVEAVLETDATAAAFWKDLSTDLKNRADGKAASDVDKQALRTKQEWCHLLGHGDGGKEIPENFVAGSQHCNTEQLALELTQRIYRDEQPRVKVSAYLLPSNLPAHRANWGAVKKSLPDIEKTDTGDTAAPTLEDLLKAHQVIDANGDYKKYRVSVKTTLEKYFTNLLTATTTTSGKKAPSGWISIQSSTFEVMSGLSTSDATAQTDKAAAAAEAVLDSLFPVVPIVYMVRYKVYIKGKKAIDHIFHGQREGVDYNEFRILQWIFRMKIADVISDDEKTKVVTLLERIEK